MVLLRRLALDRQTAGSLQIQIAGHWDRLAGELALGSLTGEVPLCSFEPVAASPPTVAAVAGLIVEGPAAAGVGRTAVPVRIGDALGDCFRFAFRRFSGRQHGVRPGWFVAADKVRLGDRTS